MLLCALLCACPALQTAHTGGRRAGEGKGKWSAGGGGCWKLPAGRGRLPPPTFPAAHICQGLRSSPHHFILPFLFVRLCTMKARSRATTCLLLLAGLLLASFGQAAEAGRRTAASESAAGR